VKHRLAGKVAAGVFADKGRGRGPAELEALASAVLDSRFFALLAHPRGPAADEAVAQPPGGGAVFVESAKFSPEKLLFPKDANSVRSDFRCSRFHFLVSNFEVLWSDHEIL
jgi:hypothetical protein